VGKLKVEPNCGNNRKLLQLLDPFFSSFFPLNHIDSLSFSTTHHECTGTPCKYLVCRYASLLQCLGHAIGSHLSPRRQYASRCHPENGNGSPGQLCTYYNHSTTFTCSIEPFFPDSTHSLCDVAPVHVDALIGASRRDHTTSCSECRRPGLEKFIDCPCMCFIKLYLPTSCSQCLLIAGELTSK